MRGWIAQLVERQTEKLSTILNDAGSISQCGNKQTNKKIDFFCLFFFSFFLFSQCQLSVQTLFRYSYRPRVQSHASTSARMLKITHTGSLNYCIVWTHEETAHIGRNVWRCSCGCCSFTQVCRPKFPRKEPKLKASTLSHHFRSLGFFHTLSHI